MTDLEKRRDELAKVYVNMKDFFSYYEAELVFLSYEAGWDACLKELTSMALEFDKQKARDRAKYEDSDSYFGFLTGAIKRRCVNEKTSNANN